MNFNSFPTSNELAKAKALLNASYSMEAGTVRIRIFTVAITIGSIFFFSGDVVTQRCWALAKDMSEYGLQNPATGAETFEVATIKPSDPNVIKHLGFYASSSGRIGIGGASLKMIISYAFGVEEFQIRGGPKWVDTECYDVVAIAPASTAQPGLNSGEFAADPTEAQKKMLQNLLVERFALRFHRELREGPVYLLTRGSTKLALHPPKDKNAEPRGGVFIKSDGIVDGEAYGENLSMGGLAKELTSELDRPVLDRTGLQGSYDFHIPPVDPSNQDYLSGASNALQRLGLQLKTGRAPVPTIIIDSVSYPTKN